MGFIKTCSGVIVAVVSAGLIFIVTAIIASNQGNIREIITTRPVAITIGTSLIFLFSGILIAWHWLCPQGLQADSAQKEREIDIVKVVIVSTAGLTVGWYLITAASSYADGGLTGVAVQVSTGWAMAYFAVAFLAGFLFGIPKVVENGNNTKNGPPRGNGSSQVYDQRVNTNLEQISDWLTKIIVGLGLVELRKMPDYLHRAASWMAVSLTNKTGTDLEKSASFCCAFILFFAAVGFLTGYLLTRLFLAGAFRRAEASIYADSKESESTSASDGDSKKIRDFWKPNDKKSDDADQKISAWLEKKGLDISIPLFIRGAEYASQRAEFAKEVVDS